MDALTDIELEKSVLGTILSNNTAMDEIAEHFNTDLFSLQSHQNIAKAVASLYQEGITPDPIEVSTALEKNAQLNACGGRIAIMQLMDKTFHGGLLRPIYLLKEKQMKRALNKVSGKANTLSLDPQADAFESLDIVSQDLFAITEGTQRKEARHAFDIASINAIELEKIATEGLEVGIKTGLNNLDKLLLMSPGTMNIIAGRPAMGKTATILQMALNMAGNGNAVGLLSLEMKDNQLVGRLQSNECDIPLWKIKKAKLNQHDWAKYADGTSRLKNMPIYIDDQPAITIMQMRSKARMLKRKYDIRVLFIDYLQLMREPSMKNNREQEISLISRSVKQLAKDLDIVCIPLAQLSRAVETRGGDKRPELSDLRDSGSLEQDADSVTFLYRPAYYGITEDEYGNSTEGIIEYLVRKQRDGETGTAKQIFNGEFQRISGHESEIDIDKFQPPIENNRLFNLDNDTTSFLL